MKKKTITFEVSRFQKELVLIGLSGKLGALGANLLVAAAEAD
jgi:hypothetical protein